MVEISGLCSENETPNHPTREVWNLGCCIGIASSRHSRFARVLFVNCVVVNNKKIWSKNTIQTSSIIKASVIQMERRLGRAEGFEPLIFTDQLLEAGIIGIPDL